MLKYIFSMIVLTKNNSTNSNNITTWSTTDVWVVVDSSKLPR